MVLSPQLLTILVFVSLALGLLALFVLVASAPRRRRDHAQRPLAPGDVLVAHDSAIEKMREGIRTLANEQARQENGLRTSIRRVGLVRYDAFEDMAGHLSFSAALLDDDGSGIVITSINGRQDTRCYAKPVEAGASEFNLSHEEEEAIGQALSAKREASDAPIIPRERRARRIRSGA